MSSSAAKAAHIAIAMTLVAYLVGRRVASRAIQRLRQSLVLVDANLAEIQRLGGTPRPLDEDAVVERTRVEIADWDLPALATSLDLEKSH